MKRRLGSLVSAREKGAAIRRPFGEVTNRDLGVPDGPAAEDVIDRVATAGSDGVFVRGRAP